MRRTSWWNAMLIPKPLQRQFGLQTLQEGNALSLITICYFDSELFGFFSDLFRFKFCSLGVNSIIDTMSLKKPNNRSSSDTEVDVLRNSSPQCFSSTKRT